ncbi:MAG: hypothetical protein JNK15_12560, partial [Planctomycetes bacterium]|nr:hypothetical protein [Planctomycetota bacterium]
MKAVLLGIVLSMLMAAATVGSKLLRARAKAAAPFAKAIVAELKDLGMAHT